MNSIGHLIALERQNKRWTQQRLASEIYLNQSQLSDIENNKTSPKWNTLVLIAEKLEVHVTILLPLIDNNKKYIHINENLGETFINYNILQEERKLWECLVLAKEEIINAQKQLIEALKK